MRIDDDMSAAAAADLNRTALEAGREFKHPPTWQIFLAWAVLVLLISMAIAGAGVVFHWW